MFPGYWRRDDATRDAFDADGWFRSGDVGAFDDDGYLSIVGRAKELIISGGFNVYPREVEDVLLTHPGVAEVAVVGEPSDEWGEVVVAVVVATDDPPPAEADAARAAPPATSRPTSNLGGPLRRRVARATRWARSYGTSSDRQIDRRRVLSPRSQAGVVRMRGMDAHPLTGPRPVRPTIPSVDGGPQPGTVGVRGQGVHRRSRLRAPAGCAGIPTHDPPSP